MNPSSNHISESFFALIVFGLIAFTFLMLYFTYTFKPFIYQNGLTLFRRTLHPRVQSSVMIPRKKIKTEEGVYYIADRRNIYFISRLKWGVSFRRKSNMPFKGVAHLKPNGQVEVVGRISLDQILTTTFFIIIAFGYLVFGKQPSKEEIPGLVFVIVPLVLAISFYIGYRIELSKMEDKVLDLMAILEGRQS